MKTKAWKIASAVVFVTAGVWVGMVVAKPLEVYSSTITPGTIEDPVVTKSYVDEQIAKLTASAGGGTANPGTGGTETGVSSKLEVVEVPAGQILMAAAGTEVVVRVGDAVAYSSDTNGISDVTEGKDIKSGLPVPRNHLIWFPREGRGIQAAEGYEEPLTVLVKGPYTISE